MKKIAHATQYTELCWILMNLSCSGGLTKKGFIIKS